MTGHNNHAVDFIFDKKQQSAATSLENLWTHSLSNNFFVNIPVLSCINTS